MADAAETEASFRDAVREQTRLIDVTLIAAIPIVMLGVFALPRATKMEFVLYYTRPTILTAYTSHFVHLGVEHLLVNLLFYVLLVPVTYLSWTLAGRRKTFLVIAVVVILTYPFLLSWVNLSLVRNRFGFGFSGMNAALLGSLPLALVEYLRVRFGLNIDLSYSPLYFFVGAAIIATISVPPSYLSVFAGLMAVFGALTYAAWTFRSIESRTALRGVLRSPGFGELAIGGHVLFLLFPFVAFPMAPEGGVSLANYFIHLLGFAMGFIAPFVTLNLVDIH